jgi:[acyl-carrier-protein] S-malonyltransferase
MKAVFLFPGQGAQVVGMGRDVARNFPVADVLFKKANEIVGYDLAQICFEGPAEKLNSTTISQPGIFVTSAAILEVLKTEALIEQPDAAAGLSLGEYTALYAAGVISFADGLALVQKRAQAMQAAADASKGSMVSIIGLDEDKVVELCAQAGKGELLKPANFNCPGQIVITGTVEACARAAKMAEDFGAIKAVVLDVAGAFHCEMMAPAAQALAEAIGRANIGQAKNIKIIANVDAEYYSGPEQISHGLVKQLTQPILWQKCMKRLLRDGFERFYEIGPGRVLTGLMRRINRKTKVINISSCEAIKDLH